MSLANQAIDGSLEVQERILDAARQRFQQFGYNKTTMAEIAEDCKMSAANLYRYFENKQAIGAQLATHCLNESIEKFRQVLANNNSSASERLTAFVWSVLQDTYDRWSKMPRINELVQMILTERQDVIQRFADGKRDLLVKLLVDANQSGEFDVADPSVTAEAILTAIKMFSVPIFMGMYPIETFERNANDVTQLMLRGLLKR